MQCCEDLEKKPVHRKATQKLHWLKLCEKHFGRIVNMNNYCVPCKLIE